jgi:plasmid stabilization system protein ParE
LRDIHDYIAADNPVAAERMYRRLRKAIDMLGPFPRLGREGIRRASRELAVANSPYVLIYRIIGGEVEVLRILHGAIRWPPGEED